MDYPTVEAGILFLSGYLLPKLFGLGYRYSSVLSLMMEYSKDGFTAEELKQIFKAGIEANKEK